MTELRERLADLLYDRLLGNGNQVTEGECVAYAAEVLAVPEIQEALRYRNAVLASRLPDLPPARVGEIMNSLANRAA